MAAGVYLLMSSATGRGVRFDSGNGIPGVLLIRSKEIAEEIISKRNLTGKAEAVWADLPSVLAYLESERSLGTRVVFRMESADSTAPMQSIEQAIVILDLRLQNTTEGPE